MVRTHLGWEEPDPEVVKQLEKRAIALGHVKGTGSANRSSYIEDIVKRDLSKMEESPNTLDSLTRKRKELSRKLGKIQNVFATLTMLLKVPNLRDDGLPKLQGQVIEIKRALYKYSTEPASRSGTYRVPWSVKLRNYEGSEDDCIFDYALEDLENYEKFLNLGLLLEQMAKESNKDSIDSSLYSN